MGFKMTLELDVDQNPAAIGEALRSRFFDEEVKPLTDHRGRQIRDPWSGALQTYRETGCYSTFEWQPDVVPLPELPVVGEDVGLKWTRGSLQFPSGETIECRWYWDGDGTLAFKLPDGRFLVNTDCKKDYEWRLYDSEEEF